MKINHNILTINIGQKITILQLTKNLTTLLIEFFYWFQFNQKIINLITVET
jgi:hypothetical protein